MGITVFTLDLAGIIAVRSGHASGMFASFTFHIYHRFTAMGAAEFTADFSGFIECGAYCAPGMVALFDHGVCMYVNKYASVLCRVYGICKCYLHLNIRILCGSFLYKRRSVI